MQSFTAYNLHALADGNQHIRIREKMLEFSPTELPVSTLSPYHDFVIYLIIFYGH